MISTSVTSCNILAELLKAHGVKNIIVSPGSRNVPLIVALNRTSSLKVQPVIDERQAAFIALGISVQTREPVAIVCTSGTALLNYAPAVAEAYYRGVPLIVISADRPKEWIDQDDSQTIWQDHALDAWVKRSWSFDASAGDWEVNREINDLLLEAVTGFPGPVHLNFRLSSPLGRLEENNLLPQRVIQELRPGLTLDNQQLYRLNKKLKSPTRVMIIAGFNPPSARVDAALEKLSQQRNIIILAEKNTNLHVPGAITCIDSTLTSGVIPEEPSLIISFGGALVSRFIKEYLRRLPDGVEHWSVGDNHGVSDCFKHLTLKIPVPAEDFFTQIAENYSPATKRTTFFKESWLNAFREGQERVNQLVTQGIWSDFTAMHALLTSLPQKWNLHFSNGTAIRYAQLFDYPAFNRAECNRGVSGIDGCLSTAIGAASAFRGTTALITGDMSLQYDISALGSRLIPKNFKIIVLCNQGGGIFRYVESTAGLEEREIIFGAGVMNLPLRKLAKAYNFRFIQATDRQSLSQGLQTLISYHSSPCILAIETPIDTSASLLREFLNPTRLN